MRTNNDGGDDDDDESRGICNKKMFTHFILVLVSLSYSGENVLFNFTQQCWEFDD